jgi:hypothetical protein
MAKNSFCEKVNIFNWFKQQKQNDSPESDQQALVKEDEERSEKLRKLERKSHMLSEQKEGEERATASGVFIKKQSARYLHKASKRWFDAHVVGVHLDDGPDNPYYTIKYQSTDGEWIEKQTTQERLEPVEWDEDRTWKILSSIKGGPVTD